MEKKKIHFIGIGGISMSGIAEILLEDGHTITGSDIALSKPVQLLRKKGVTISLEENPDLVDDADIVIYTNSIKNDNKELVRAKELKKVIYERAQFLGLLSKDYQNVICISGTHGKSTTTGMVASCFLEDQKNPTIQIGAFLPKINANYLVGSKNYFIMEACEYQDSFLHFYPTSEIILNIDLDHLDYFKNLKDLQKSFLSYAKRLPNGGFLVLNGDDENTMAISYPDNIKVLTYGIKNKTDVMAQNISYDDLGYPEFDVYVDNNFYIHLHLQVLGNHNIYNALATTALCMMYNLNKNSIIEGLQSYHGVERRFEFIGMMPNNILIYDDYAHHPTEIKSTVETTKNIKCHKNWAVFQSHTYSRTKQHLEEFADVLKEFDNIIIAPIYAAREINTFNVSESDLVNLIKKDNSNVIYLESYDKIVEYLKANIKPDDLVITIGAGPINEVGLKLLNK